MAKRANGTGHNSGRNWLTRSYNFIDKDPEIDRFRTIWQREHIKESDLAVLAGLSPSTVKNMFGGETRRPQHATFAKMAGAMGYVYGLVREEKDKPNYQREIPKAVVQLKDYRVMQAKKRERQQQRKVAS